MTQELTTYTTGGELTVATPGGVAMLERAIGEMGVGLFDLEKLRVPGSGGTTWEVPSLEGSTPERELRMVMTNVRMNQRAWYRTGADEGDGGGPPDCSSTDSVTGYGVIDMTFDEDAEPSAHACATCPWGQWGSDRDGGKGKDCREFAWVVGFTPGSALPYQLSVPTMSLKPLRQYLLKLMAAGRKPEEVVTRMTLKKNGSGASAFSSIEFSVDGMLDSGASELTTRAMNACNKLFRDGAPQAAAPAPVDGLE